MKYLLLISLIIIAVSAVLSISSYFYKYQFQYSQTVISVSKSIMKGFVVFSILFTVYIFMFLGEKFPHPIERYLCISVKDNNPCFYDNPFKYNNDYIIEKIKVVEVTSRREYTKVMWKKNLDIPISSMFGEDQCVLYGGKNASFFNKAKILQIGVLYNVNMTGIRKKDKSDYLSDDDQIDLSADFYLIKNQTTKQTEVVIPNTEEKYNLIKKLEEQK